MIRNIFVSFLLVLPIVSISATTYNMEDLNTLAKSKSWTELTAHLSDIPPSKRDQNWAELANLALSTKFSELVASGNAKIINEFLTEIYPKYPGLKTNDAFMKLRRDFGISYYDSCFSYNDEDCHKELLGFVKADPDPDYAFKVAKLVRLRMSNTKAIEYFNLAITQKSSNVMCEDEDLKISLEESLQSTPDSDYAKAAKVVAFGRCFENLKGTIKSAVKNSDNAKSIACQELLIRNAATGITKAKCTDFVKIHQP